MMKKLIYILKRILYPPRESRRIANEFVKKYYEENKHKKFKYVHNVWSKNIYWDYFLQSLPHSVQSPYYIPRDYYAIEVEPRLKNHLFSDFVNEKNYYDKVFSNFDIILPITFIHCINGSFLDNEYNKIEDIETEIRNIKCDVICKSATGGSGENILKFIFKDNLLKNDAGEKLDLMKLKKYYQGNFLVQECISQHNEIARFHPGTLNTIRAITYKSVKSNEVHVISAMLRIGLGKSVVDNISAGGIAVSIDLKDGTLNKYAFDKYGNYWLTHPDTAISFLGSSIPHFETIMKQLVKLGYFLGHSKVIGWDVSVDNNGKMILIEPNVGIGAWMSQIADGRPLFGEFSQEVYDYVKARKMV